MGYIAKLFEFLCNLCAFKMIDTLNQTFPPFVVQVFFLKKLMGQQMSDGKPNLPGLINPMLHKKVLQVGVLHIKKRVVQMRVIHTGGVYKTTL